jgi:hypothetical protein
MPNVCMLCVCVCGEEGAGQKLNQEITTGVLQTYLLNLPTPSDCNHAFPRQLHDSPCPQLLLLLQNLQPATN